MSSREHARAVAKKAYEKRHSHFFEGTSMKNQEDWIEEVLLVLCAAVEVDTDAQIEA